MQFRVKHFLTGKVKPCVIEFDDQDGVPPFGVLVVYGFVDPRIDEVFYVGQTDRFEIRMKQHVASSYPSLSVLEQRLRKIGESGNVVRAMVLAYPDSREHALELERWYIGLYHRTAMNKTHNREWRGPIT